MPSRRGRHRAKYFGLGIVSLITLSRGMWHWASLRARGRHFLRARFEIIVPGAEILKNRVEAEVC